MKQRFGTGSVPTHLIGAKLLRGEWKAAVSIILDPRDGDILLISNNCASNKRCQFIAMILRRKLHEYLFSLI